MCWYRLYLRSDRWLQTRNAVMARARWRCVECGAPATDVHHLTYERVGNERLSDLVPLCRDCHAEKHARTGRGARASSNL
jgi:5-methylcytosine-specific restriction endonuclease McrA